MARTDCKMKRYPSDILTGSEPALSNPISCQRMALFADATIA